jgi:hypothetical protein
VKQFADDESAWVQAFQAAWTKATENGFQDLVRVCAGNCNSSPMQEPQQAQQQGRQLATAAVEGTSSVAIFGMQVACMAVLATLAVVGLFAALRRGLLGKGHDSLASQPLSDQSSDRALP